MQAATNISHNSPCSPQLFLHWKVLPSYSACSAQCCHINSLIRKIFTCHATAKQLLRRETIQRSDCFFLCKTIPKIMACRSFTVQRKMRKNSLRVTSCLLPVFLTTREASQGFSFFTQLFVRVFWRYFYSAINPRIFHSLWAQKPCAMDMPHCSARVTDQRQVGRQ